MNKGAASEEDLAGPYTVSDSGDNCDDDGYEEDNYNFDAEIDGDGSALSNHIVVHSEQSILDKGISGQNQQQLPQLYHQFSNPQQLHGNRGSVGNYR